MDVPAGPGATTSMPPPQQAPAQAGPSGSSPRPLASHSPTIRPISPSVGKAAPRPGKPVSPTAGGGKAPVSAAGGAAGSPKAHPQPLNVSVKQPQQHAPLRSLGSDDSPRGTYVGCVCLWSRLT